MEDATMKTSKKTLSLTDNSTKKMAKAASPNKGVPDNKVMLSVIVDKALVERLNTWISSQPMQPRKTAVINHLLKKFLSEQEQTTSAV